ncbi:MAG: ribose 5-phosphate isomerase B [Bdellovibrionales bacterium]|nr:ribose 5-phosphate isomerase B [Bdellovibrionales bacterium]
MNIAIGSDHAGVELKKELVAHLQRQNIEVMDVGPFDNTSVDYPDFAKLVADKINANTNGILICGSGIGVSIAANKIHGVRAALVTNKEMAEMAKRHNNANVLCLGARMTNPKLAIEMVDTWINAKFEGDRHQRRLDKITNLETSGK